MNVDRFTRRSGSQRPPTSRIVLLTPLAGGTDGISEMTRQWASAFSTADATVEVWSLDDNRAAAACLPPHVRLRTARGSRVRFATFGLRSGVAAERTTVVAMHVHLAPVALPLVLRGARLLVVLNGIEAWKPLTALETMAVRRAASVVAISRHTVDRFRAANASCDDLPVCVCHPAARDVNVPGEDRQTLQLPCALIVGRMSAAERYKGHDALIEAWPSVRESCPTAVLRVVGDGDDRRRLEQKAASVCPDGVVFEGRVSAERLERLYREAACLAMPSTQEGFGLVYAEAMARGVPCIACPGAAEEVIAHGADGLIVPPGDARALTAALVALFTDGPLRTRLGEAAARRAAREFSERALRDRVLPLIDLEGAA